MIIRLPAPLRAYTDGEREIEVRGSTVAAALADLASRHPALRPHLFDDRGDLRPFVNLFLNEDDVRSLQGAETPLSDGDRLLIVPSIAGGTASTRPVDHAALRVNQAMIIGVLIGAFISDAAWLVLLVGLIMAVGTAAGRPGFLPVYRLLRSLGRIRPDIVQDNPEPHRFAQGLGAAFLLAASILLYAAVPLVGWALAWAVVGLAALNLFGGLCVGCAVYYWLSRLGVPGFVKAPPPGAPPGRRPPAAAGGAG
jgi:molybdopterin converting factor small subunit